MSVKLGFLGFGEIGYVMSMGLSGEGLSPILGYDKACLTGRMVTNSISLRPAESSV